MTNLKKVQAAFEKFRKVYRKLDHEMIIIDRQIDKLYWLDHPTKKQGARLQELERRGRQVELMLSKIEGTF